MDRFFSIAAFLRVVESGCFSAAAWTSRRRRRAVRHTCRHRLSRPVPREASIGAL